MDKKELAITLSKLKSLNEFDINLEQYQSEGELISDILWKANLNGDIKNKTIADLGCGNGIFGLGALLLGAKKVYFLDIDKGALETARENYKKLKLKSGTFINKNVKNFNFKVDTVLMNPPFGVQKEHSDKLFLEQAMKVSNNIYSLHKIESKKFIFSLSKNNNFKLKEAYEYNFLIKQTYRFHKRKSYFVKVGGFYLTKIK